MSHISEYEVENILIDRLESIGYSFIKMKIKLHQEKTKKIKRNRQPGSGKA